MLLHLVDMSPFDGSTPAEHVKAIMRELERFSPTLAGRERWLVLNKLDLLPETEREKACKEIVKKLKWKGRVFRISAINGSGTAEMCRDIMEYLEEQKILEAENPELQEQEKAKQEAMQAEAREKIRALAAARRAARAGVASSDEWDDEHDVEFVYVP